MVPAFMVQLDDQRPTHAGGDDQDPHLAKSRHETAQLNQGTYTFQNAHMRKPDLFDVLELGVLRYPTRDDTGKSLKQQTRASRTTHSSKVLTTRNMVTIMSMALYP